MSSSGCDPIVEEVLSNNVDVRQYCAGLVRLCGLLTRLQGLRDEVLVKKTPEYDPIRPEINRYGNTLFLEFIMLKTELLRLEALLTPEEREDVKNYTFTPEEVEGIDRMTPVIGS
jgi:hypothetical protein